MIKYVIKNTSDERPKEVEVELDFRKNGDVILKVGGWCIFQLLPNGKGHLNKCTPKLNKAGLQVNKEGQIILEGT